MESKVSGIMDQTQTLMSNFDHTIDRDVAKELKAKPAKLCGQHSAWDFCGYVWFENGKWYEEVWVCKAPKAIFTADTLEDLMSEVNSEYGSG